MQNLFDYLHDLIRRDIHPTEREEEIWQRYGKKAAVMVIDSSGFSRVTQKHGIIHFLSQLMQMREMIQSVCARYRTLAFRFEADNVYVVFESPNDALRAAMSIHEKIHEENLMLTEDERFRVSIGIGFGDLLYSETLEGYFGDEMNLASKLGEDTAQGGETMITRAVYSNVDENLVSHFVPRRLSIAGIDAPCHILRFEP